MSRWASPPYKAKPFRGLVLDDRFTCKSNLIINQSQFLSIQSTRDNEQMQGPLHSPMTFSSVSHSIIDDEDCLVLYTSITCNFASHICFVCYFLDSTVL
uniref:Ovule protein n=1 Tax=Panagrellus redivivus TaxID=6233 RepID=A0A7E4ZZ23_PANRE